MILFGRGALDRAIASFVAHYDRERSHQALDNDLLNPDEALRTNTGEVVRRERLGGLLSFYHHAAA